MLVAVGSACISIATIHGIALNWTIERHVSIWLQQSSLIQLRENFKVYTYNLKCNELSPVIPFAACYRRNQWSKRTHITYSLTSTSDFEFENQRAGHQMSVEMVIGDCIGFRWLMNMSVIAVTYLKFLSSIMQGLYIRWENDATNSAGCAWNSFKKRYCFLLS